MGESRILCAARFSVLWRRLAVHSPSDALKQVRRTAAAPLTRIASSPAGRRRDPPSRAGRLARACGRRRRCWTGPCPAPRRRGAARRRTASSARAAPAVGRGAALAPPIRRVRVPGLPAGPGGARPHDGGCSLTVIWSAAHRRSYRRSGRKLMVGSTRYLQARKSFRVQYVGCFASERRIDWAKLINIWFSGKKGS